MNFRLEHHPEVLKDKIALQHTLFLAGSCFTEQIGGKLSNVKFNIFENPFGILFNPVSIATCILECIEKKVYRKEDLFLKNGIWSSWNHHTRFSNLDCQQCLDDINSSIASAHAFLKNARWLMLTLGSSFVYEWNGQVVANCHKVPTDKFEKRLLTADEIRNVMLQMIQLIKRFNPDINIIFTISPVRHLRDGFVENNRSKANLITAVHQLVSECSFVHYFPAYELIVDDLRDYRYFAEDMVHPNYTATHYVWEKFLKSCVEESTQLIIKEILSIRTARNHKAFNPLSLEHKKFKKTYLEKTISLSKQYPFLDFSEEINFFTENQ